MKDPSFQEQEVSKYSTASGKRYCGIAKLPQTLATPFPLLQSCLPARLVCPIPISQESERLKNSCCLLKYLNYHVFYFISPQDIAVLYIPFSYLGFGYIWLCAYVHAWLPPAFPYRKQSGFKQKFVS